MEIDFNILGKRIAQRRRELGLKQNELAEIADISNNYLSNIETGRSIPSLTTFATLCKCLKTTPDNFLLGTIKTDNIPQHIIDNLKLCNEDSLPLINDFIQLLINKNYIKKN
jgi:transcriptional regulator with XRE-family HTH domain